MPEISLEIGELDFSISNPVVKEALVNSEKVTRSYSSEY